MPLMVVRVGQQYTVKQIHGRSEIRTFLEKLGLVPGGTIEVVSRNASGLILNIRGSRVALGRDMACKVMV
ncbi:MAG: ferrous iron transport protein A [Eggerthellaceae bacterium]|jgi:ferrous iron transport protein A|nr:ferrous iron transport protein A [Eggerthellaceae bacterium]MCH4221690.1 ferrous iron transport protein A [Eggerthellaceae bacterium]